MMNNNNYAMTTTLSNTSNRIEIDNRKLISISGVKNIESFDSKDFLMNTTLGHLHICGQDLTLEKMDLEKGEVLIKGLLNSLNYLSPSKNGKKDSFVKKVFK